MAELWMFYGLLSAFLVGGLVYSLHLYYKSMNKHEENHSPGAHD